MAHLTSEQVQVLRRFATEEAAHTRLGRRWLELLHVHQQELFQRYAASATLRQHADQAAGEAAALIESLGTGRPRVIDDAAIAPVQAVLTELDTRASTELRGATAEVGRDLQAASGKTVRQALGPRES
jgi:hypothetical protein